MRLEATDGNSTKVWMTDDELEDLRRAAASRRDDWRRRDTIELRVVVESHGGVGVDVCHDVRSDDHDGTPTDWTPAEMFEAPEHGVEKITAADGGEWWS